MTASRCSLALGALAAVAGGLVIGSCSDHTAPPLQVPVASITLTPGADTMLVADSLTVAADLRDARGGALSRPVTWESSDPTIATVTPAGVVRGHDSGPVSIVARVNGISGIAQITVQERIATMVFDSTALTLHVGDTVALHLTLKDPHGTTLVRPLAWAVVDSTVATVDTAGHLVGRKGGGSAVVASAEGKADTLPITVLVPVAQVAIDTTVTTVQIGDTLRLHAQAFDSKHNALERPIAWSSGTPLLATVDSTGLVTAKAVGAATIVATSDGGTGSITVAVIPRIVGLTITTDPSNLFIHTGQRTHLAVVLSSMTADKAPGASPNAVALIAYATRDSAVAKIDAAGDVTGIGRGRTWLLATSGIYTDSAEVVVQWPVQRVRLVPEDVALNIPDQVALAATALDSAGNEIVAHTFTWTSSDSTIASVSSAGIVTARATGTATITASTDSVVGSARVVVGGALTMSIVPATDSLAIGDTLVLAATLSNGEDVKTSGRPLTWSTSSSAVTIVDGVLAAVGEGVVTVTATSREKTATATIAVFPAPDHIAITTPVSHMRVGDNGMMKGAALDVSGNMMTGGHITWTSSNPAVATVDQTGTITTLSEGTTTITAKSGTTTQSVQITVSGMRPTESSGMGNNLSWPVIFTDGIGLSGQRVSANGQRNYSGTGLRPAAAENLTDNLTTGGLPFFYIGNAPNCLGPDGNRYYCQQGLNTWQAEWLDGSGSAPLDAVVKWGDNITGHAWTTASHIRVEVSLTNESQRLAGYAMKSLSGMGPTEIVAATGARIDTFPSLFSITPRLIIQKLDAQNGNPVYTAFDTSLVKSLGSAEEMGRFGVEVNRSGKIVYGYMLQLSALPAPPAGVDRAGWYRISFVLDGNTQVDGQPVSPNVILKSIAPSTESETEGFCFPPQVSADGRMTWIDIQLASGSTGEGGGSCSASGGDGGDGGEGGEGGGPWAGNAIEPGPGNNLSWPVVFAEGIGLGGVAVTEDVGLRPKSTENITVGARPFFFTGNAVDTTLLGVSYYLQNAASVWQADWLNGAGSERRVQVQWPDSLMQVTYTAHETMRIEVTLSDLDAGQMQGYNMMVVPGDTMRLGTDGTLGMFVPTVYSEAGRLIVEKLDDADTTLAPILTVIDKGAWVHDSLPVARINSSGKLVYVYNLKLQNLSMDAFAGKHKFGLWRFTFVLGGTGAPVQPNVRLQQIAPTGGFVRYLPTIAPDGRSSSLTVYIDRGQSSGDAGGDSGSGGTGTTGGTSGGGGMN